MKIDFLGVENLSKEEQDAKREEFKRKLQEAINKRENKEKKKNGGTKKRVKSSKTDK